MERLDGLCHGPSPRQPVRLQQCVPAVIRDVRGHAMEQFDRRVVTVPELAQVLMPDAPGAIVVTHRSKAAVAEAAIIVSALRSQARGWACRHNRIPMDDVGAAPGNDVRAEATRLILVCHAIHRSSIVRSAAGRLPGEIKPFSLLATCLYGAPAAGFYEDASARLREHPAPLRLVELEPVLVGNLAAKVITLCHAELVIYTSLGITQRHADAHMPM